MKQKKQLLDIRFQVTLKWENGGGNFDKSAKPVVLYEYIDYLCFACALILNSSSFLRLEENVDRQS